jgi:hypothetical protein
MPDTMIYQISAGRAKISTLGIDVDEKKTYHRPSDKMKTMTVKEIDGITKACRDELQCSSEPDKNAITAR